MTNEISKQQKVICLKSGKEIWIDKNKANELENHLQNLSTHVFIRIEEVGETINSAEIEGVFNSQTIKEFTKQKNGQWKCDYGKWHRKREYCDCIAIEIEKRKQEKQRNYFEESNREICPEEREIIKNKLAQMGKELGEKLGWGNKSPIPSCKA